MSQTLFAERFLVTPVGPEPPEPAGYDEARGISLTADGRPFIEAGAVLSAVTLTEAEGEACDEDRAAHMTLHTETRAPGEKTDAPPWAHTHTAAPGEPVDYDRIALVATFTKNEGERPD